MLTHRVLKRESSARRTNTSPAFSLHPRRFYKHPEFGPHPHRLHVRFVIGNGTAFLAYPLKPRPRPRPVYTTFMVIWKGSGMFSLKASRLIRAGHASLQLSPRKELVVLAQRDVFTFRPKTMRSPNRRPCCVWERLARGLTINGALGNDLNTHFTYAWISCGTWVMFLKRTF